MTESGNGAVLPGRDGGSVDINDQALFSRAGVSDELGEPQPAPPSPFSPSDAPEASGVDTGAK